MGKFVSAYRDNWIDQDDVSQEVALRVWIAMKSARINPLFGSEQQFAAGVKRRVKLEVLRELQAPLIASESAFTKTPTNDPAILAELREQVMIAEEAIDSLPEHQRAEVLKRLTECFSGGKTMPLSSTQRSRCSRGLLRVRTVLDG